MRQRTQRTILAIFLVTITTFLATQKCAIGAPVYSQVLPAEPVGAFPSSQERGTNAQIVADNFIVSGTEPFTVRSLRFVGGYGANFPPPPPLPMGILPPDSFRILFLEDAANSPGVPIVSGDFSITSAFSRTPTGGRLLNGVFNPIEFVVDLGDGVTLNQGTEYWISITNDPGPDYGWAWARAAGLFDQQTAGTINELTAGPWNVFENGGMYFELNNQNVPEPNSLVILLVSLSTIVLKRRTHCFLRQFVSPSQS